MTVQQMIDELNKVEDKSKQMIWVQDHDASAYDCEIESILEFKHSVSVNGAPDCYGFEY